MSRFASALSSTLQFFVAIALLGSISSCEAPSEEEELPRADSRIQPYAENPRYWRYEGDPVLLLGGTKEDNLFQIDSLEAHLDKLVSVGGNYIRNTMSSRDSGNVEPFHRRPDGRYDLDRWNETYWNRFERMLELTHERNIVPQIELWDQHDHNEDKWNTSPWNPDQNVNYDMSEVTLRGDGNYANVQHNTGVRHDLFLTVPALQNDATVLAYQRRFVDRVLDYALQYDHVLYTITNELFIQHPADWSRHWAKYLRRRAEEEGVEIEVTEMFQINDVEHEQHRASLDHPEIFDYVDISQNARRQGEEHWEKFHWVRSYISDHPRPINHVKTYGGKVEWTYGPDQAIDCFWRSVIGGAASMRFHRPPAGIGLYERTQDHIESARMLTDSFDVFASQPDVESSLLAERSDDEAYLTYIPEQSYAVYFPSGGAVELDLTEVSGSFEMRWLNIAESQWQEAVEVDGGSTVALETPEDGDWAVLLQRR